MSATTRSPTCSSRTDWLEEHLDDPSGPGDRGRRGHDRVRQGTHRRRPPVELDHRPAHRGRPRLPGPGRVLTAARPRPGSATARRSCLYGGNNNWFAAYAYWLLKLRGFDDVKLLNGGRKKWELESRELTNDVPSVRGRRGFAITGAERPQIRALRDEVIGKVGGASWLRRRPLSRGVPGREARTRPPAPGAVAGARSHRRRREHPLGARPRTTTARSRSRDELRALYEAEGITRRPRDHRVLPDRRAVIAHVVRAAGAARLRAREELRRIVDRVRIAGGRAGRARRLTANRRVIRPVRWTLPGAPGYPVDTQ